MSRYRPIRPEEIEYAKMVLARDCPGTGEPDWTKLWVKTYNGRVVGFFGIQHRYLVEPAWAEDLHDMEDICTAADNYLGGAGVNVYEFYVQDANEDFQRLLERRFGISGKRELPGKTYMIDRNEANES